MDEEDKSAATIWKLPLSTTLNELLDDNGSDAEFRKLIYGIFTMTVNFERIRERMATTLGLSGIQYHILMVVAELTQTEKVTVSLIADRLHTSGAYVTMESKKLMRRGFLDKQPNPDDGRSVILHLTEEGRKTIDSFAPSLQDINDELFAGMGPETFDRFCDIVVHMTRTSVRAADLAETLAHEHTNFGDAEVVSVLR